MINGMALGFAAGALTSFLVCNAIALQIIRRLHRSLAARGDALIKISYLFNTRTPDKRTLSEQCALEIAREALRS